MEERATQWEGLEGGAGCGVGFGRFLIRKSMVVKKVFDSRRGGEGFEERAATWEGADGGGCTIELGRFLVKQSMN